MSAVTIKTHPDPDRGRRIAVAESRRDLSSEVRGGRVWSRPGDYRLVQIAALEPVARDSAGFDAVDCLSEPFLTISGRDVGHQCKAFRALSDDAIGMIVFYAEDVDDRMLARLETIFDGALLQMRPNTEG